MHFGNTVRISHYEIQFKDVKSAQEAAGWLFPF